MKVDNRHFSFFLLFIYFFLCGVGGVGGDHKCRTLVVYRSGTERWLNGTYFFGAESPCFITSGEALTDNLSQRSPTHPYCAGIKDGPIHFKHHPTLKAAKKKTDNRKLVCRLTTQYSQEAISPLMCMKRVTFPLPLTIETHNELCRLRRHLSEREGGGREREREGGRERREREKRQNRRKRIEEES